MHLKLLIKKFIYSLFAVIALGYFCSCSESEAEINSVLGYVVLDYADAESVPFAKMAAFVETESDVHRVQRISVRCLQDDFQWICDDPLIFANDDKQWAGFTEFYLPLNEKFKAGIYELEYDDAQENTVSSSFNISFKEEYFSKKSEEIQKDVKETSREQIALYDSNGLLLYFGQKKSHWRNDNFIFASNKNSAYYRPCYISYIDAVVYIFPPVYKDSLQKDGNTDGGKK